LTRKVVGVFVRFRAPLHPRTGSSTIAAEVVGVDQHGEVFCWRGNLTAAMFLP
jgi:hypothetical protein